MSMFDRSRKAYAMSHQLGLNYRIPYYGPEIIKTVTAVEAIPDPVSENDYNKWVDSRRFRIIAFLLDADAPGYTIQPVRLDYNRNIPYPDSTITVSNARQIVEVLTYGLPCTVFVTNMGTGGTTQVNVSYSMYIRG